MIWNRLLSRLYEMVGFYSETFICRLEGLVEGAAKCKAQTKKDRVSSHHTWQMVMEDQKAQENMISNRLNIDVFPEALISEPDSIETAGNRLQEGRHGVGDRPGCLQQLGVLQAVLPEDSVGSETQRSNICGIACPRPYNANCIRSNGSKLALLIIQKMEPWRPCRPGSFNGVTSALGQSPTMSSFLLRWGQPGGQGRPTGLTQRLREQPQGRERDQQVQQVTPVLSHAPQET